jgi:hypothetical protein
VLAAATTHFIDRATGWKRRQGTADVMYRPSFIAAVSWSGEAVKSLLQCQVVMAPVLDPTHSKSPSTL